MPVQLCDSLMWYRRFWLPHWDFKEILKVKNDYVREAGKFLSSQLQVWQITGDHEWMQPGEVYRIGGLKARGTVPYSVAEKMDEAHRIGLIGARSAVTCWLVNGSTGTNKSDWQRLRSAANFMLDEIT